MMWFKGFTSAFKCKNTAVWSAAHVRDCCLNVTLWRRHWGKWTARSVCVCVSLTVRLSCGRDVPRMCCWMLFCCRWRRVLPWQPWDYLPPPAVWAFVCRSVHLCEWRHAPLEGCPGPPPAHTHTLWSINSRLISATRTNRALWNPFLFFPKFRFFHLNFFLILFFPFSFFWTPF